MLDPDDDAHDRDNDGYDRDHVGDDNGHDYGRDGDGDGSDDNDGYDCEIADDDIVRFEDHVAYRNESYLVSIPDEAGVPVEEVSEIRVGHSWLISGFPTITPD